MTRIGIGYDLHRLVTGRRFMLGGVDLGGNRGPEGHSDGDVLLHALIDALLGAAALGDIGAHFPQDDPQWKGADSAALLLTVKGDLDAAGYSVQNIDANVIVEQPRLAPYIPAIRARIAALLGLAIDRVSVKAKTNERLGPVGEGLAIIAEAVVLIERQERD